MFIHHNPQKRISLRPKERFWRHVLRSFQVRPAERPFRESSAKHSERAMMVNMDGPPTAKDLTPLIDDAAPAKVP